MCLQNGHWGRIPTQPDSHQHSHKQGISVQRDSHVSKQTLPQKTNYTDRIKLVASIRFSPSHRIDYSSHTSPFLTFITKSRFFSSPNHHKTPSCIKSVITEGSRQFSRSIRSSTSRGRLSRGVSRTRWCRGEETAGEEESKGAGNEHRNVEPNVETDRRRHAWRRREIRFRQIPRSKK